MNKENVTMVTEFHLLGFRGLHSFRVVFFYFFLLIYIVTLTGNLLIILLVSTSHQLHSPMYLFLSHLSLSDILFTTTIVPNMLYIIWEEGGTISFAACITQLELFGASIGTESLLLTAMSYDRYLAICNPLRYTVIMDLRLQYQLVIWSWLLGFMIILSLVILICQLQFCGPNVIDHYFCDFSPILDLSCSDTSIIKIEQSVLSIPCILLPFVFIVVTYFYIFHTILKISSTTGRQKAYSTCSAHLAVVCAYYGSLIAIYMAATRGHTFNANKFLSLLNTVGTPLFNPIIYSLRNQDIKESIVNIVRRKQH
ncbi:olfactory receptor 11L1-like [Ascaphus truei]|uniref:olfactory receptor 11L1-like n=1 Tax=Ascaphus truei TaxID=8439 RepID=UPI003F5A4488